MTIKKKIRLSNIISLSSKTVTNDFRLRAESTGFPFGGAGNRGSGTEESSVPESTSVDMEGEIKREKGGLNYEAISEKT